MVESAPTTITDVIVWASPVGFGFIAWLTHELYSGLKEDVKQVKTSSANIRTDVAKLAVQQSNTDAKVETVCRSVEKLTTLTHEIDKRNGTHNGVGKPELELAMQAAKQTESRVTDLDKKYGQILMILHGMAKRVGIDIKKSGT